jgi:hypothetical protein
MKGGSSGHNLHAHPKETRIIQDYGHGFFFAAFAFEDDALAGSSSA